MFDLLELDIIISNHLIVIPSSKSMESVLAIEINYLQITAPNISDTTRLLTCCILEQNQNAFQKSFETILTLEISNIRSHNFLNR